MTGSVRTAIADRISAARLRLEAQGRPWGRPSRLTRQDRERIAELAAAGLSHRAIAQRIRLPKSTVTMTRGAGKEGYGMTTHVVRLPIQHRPSRGARIARVVGAVISALTAAAIGGWFR